MQINSTRGADLADTRQILAKRPDIYFLIAWTRVLDRENHSGRLSLPAQLDLRGVNLETIRAAASLITAVTGGGKV